MPRKKLITHSSLNTVTSAQQMMDDSSEGSSVGRKRQQSSRNDRVGSRVGSRSQPTLRKPLETTTDPSHGKPTNDTLPADDDTDRHVLVQRDRDAALERLRLENRAAEKEQQRQQLRSAVELRKAGATFATIALQCGFKSEQSARTQVGKYLNRLAHEEQEQLRTIQMERLLHMLLVIWPQVQNGSTNAINTALSIWDRINRHGGVDTPAQVQVEHTGLPEQRVLVIGGDSEAYKNALARMAGLELQQELTTPPSAGSGEETQTLDAVAVEQGTDESSTAGLPGDAVSFPEIARDVDIGGIGAPPQAENTGGSEHETPYTDMADGMADEPDGEILATAQRMGFPDDLVSVMSRLRARTEQTESE